MGGLSQSDKLFGALLIAFIIYITVRGQLPAPKGYLGIFTHNTTSTSAANNATPASQATNIFSKIATTVTSLATLFGG